MLWELRASTKLARLWRDQGKRGEVRDLRGSIYGWCTEGFDRLDLNVAKALLDELGSAPVIASTTPSAGFGSAST